MKYLILLGLLVSAACTPIPDKALFVYQTEAQKAAYDRLKAAGMSDMDAYRIDIWK